MIDKRENVLQLNYKKQPDNSVNIEQINKAATAVKKTVNSAPVKKVVSQVEKVVAKPAQIKEYKVIGKYKKKVLLFKSVSADVLEYASKMYQNDNITEVIESALIASIKANDENMYKSLVNKLNNEGGKIL